MIAIISITYFLFCFIFSSFYFLFDYYKKSDIISYSYPPKEYIELVQESYNIVPDVNLMLNCLKSLHYARFIKLFYIIDSIRLLSKAMRSQNFTKMLSKKDGDISIFYDQMFIYMNNIITTNKIHKIRNICEIGFQVGAGALTLMTSLNENLTYYGFDYGMKYSRLSYNIIANYFNMNMEWGKSEETVTGYKNITCNVVHIDGYHSQSAIYNDIKNMKRLSNRNTLIFLDDVNINSKCIKEAKNDLLIENIKCFKWKPFCICKYYL